MWKRKKNDRVEFYIKSVKKLLPFYGAKEKEYIRRLRMQLAEYAQGREDVSYDTLIAEFGSPSHVTSEYFAEMDEAYLFRHLRIRKYVRGFLIFLLVSFVLLESFRYYLAYCDYRNGQEIDVIYEEKYIYH